MSALSPSRSRESGTKIEVDDHTRKSKVHERRLSVPVDDDVIDLDIAVSNLGFQCVKILQRLGDLLKLRGVTC